MQRVEDEDDVGKEHQLKNSGASKNILMKEH